MTRRYVWLSIFCASIMFCLASNSPLTHALWKLSFVPEAAARQEPSLRRPFAERPPGALARAVGPHTQGEATHSQE
jgi:hypothetical protein